MVVGSDDEVFFDAFDELILNLANGNYDSYDVVSFPVFMNSRILNPKKYMPISFSVASLITQHSVGTILRKCLHDKLGYYDVRYKILADSAFIKLSFLNGVNFFYDRSIIPGVFSFGGVSTSKHLDRIFEAFHYNMQLGSVFVLQLIYLTFRLIKYRKFLK